MRSILSLFLILLFGCEVEPYEPACVQGEYIHGHLCTEEYALCLCQMVQHMQMFVMLSKMVGNHDV